MCGLGIFLFVAWKPEQISLSFKMIILFIVCQIMTLIECHIDTLRCLIRDTFKRRINWLPCHRSPPLGPVKLTTLD